MTVTVEELGAARVVRWDRQAKRNAWTRDTIEAIADAKIRPRRPEDAFKDLTISALHHARLPQS